MGEAITETIKPRIYVACLAAYNNGILHGAWMDAAQEAWALYDDVKDMLAASPVGGAEEWAIHDYEGFGGVRIEEYTGLETVAALAAFIREHGAIGAALLDYYSADVDEAREAIDERYHGAHASLADYVQELTEETTTIPTTLRYYIDWPAMARDAEMSGDLFTLTTAWDVVHVFAGVLTMETQPQTYRFLWHGIEIEARYWPIKWGVIAHLEVKSIQPEKAPLLITATGYRSHFHQPGTVEANGGDVVAQVIAWLDEEAASHEWRALTERSRQGELF